MEDRIKELEQLANRLNAECVEATEIIQGMVTAANEQMESVDGAMPGTWPAVHAADKFLRGEESGATRINEVLDAVRKALGRPDLMMQDMAAAVGAGRHILKNNEISTGGCDCLEKFAEKFLAEYPMFQRCNLDHMSPNTGFPAMRLNAAGIRADKNGNPHCCRDKFVVEMTHCPFCGKKIQKKLGEQS